MRLRKAGVKEETTADILWQVHAVYALARHVLARVRAYVGCLDEQFRRLPGFTAPS
jgi:hypothetical protein